jgi:hypothetical protein
VLELAGKRNRLRPPVGEAGYWLLRGTVWALALWFVYRAGRQAGLTEAKLKVGEMLRELGADVFEERDEEP